MGGLDENGAAHGIGAWHDTHDEGELFVGCAALKTAVAGFVTYSRVLLSLGYTFQVFLCIKCFIGFRNGTLGTRKNPHCQRQQVPQHNQRIMFIDST